MLCNDLLVGRVSLDDTVLKSAEVSPIFSHLRKIGIIASIILDEFYQQKDFNCIAHSKKSFDLNLLR